MNIHINSSYTVVHTSGSVVVKGLTYDFSAVTESDETTVVWSMGKPPGADEVAKKVQEQVDDYLISQTIH